MTQSVTSGAAAQVSFVDGTLEHLRDPHGLLHRLQVEQDQVGDGLRCLSGQDGGPVGNSLIRVDGPVQLLAVEEVLEWRLDLWNPSGTTDQDDIMGRALVHLSIPHGLFHRVQCAFGTVGTEPLEPHPVVGVEVGSLGRGLRYSYRSCPTVSSQF